MGVQLIITYEIIPLVVIYLDLLLMVLDFLSGNSFLSFFSSAFLFLRVVVFVGSIDVFVGRRSFEVSSRGIGGEFELMLDFVEKAAGIFHKIYVLFLFFSCPVFIGHQ